MLAPVSWDALSIPLDDQQFWSPCYAYSCFYWKVSSKNKWLKLDMSSMEFSADELIEEHGHNRNGDVIISEAGEGRVGMFHQNTDNTSLCYTIRQIAGERLDQSKIIPLPVGYWYHSMSGPYEGHIFIWGGQIPKLAEGTCFTLEIKTLKIERVCQMNLGIVRPYFGLPFMSSVRDLHLRSGASSVPFDWFGALVMTQSPWVAHLQRLFYVILVSCCVDY